MLTDVNVYKRRFKSRHLGTLSRRTILNEDEHQFKKKSLTFESKSSKLHFEALFDAMGRQVSLLLLWKESMLYRFQDTESSVF